MTNESRFQRSPQITHKFIIKMMDLCEYIYIGTVYIQYSKTIGANAIIKNEHDKKKKKSKSFFFCFVFLAYGVDTEWLSLSSSANFDTVISRRQVVWGQNSDWLQTSIFVLCT